MYVPDRMYQWTYERLFMTDVRRYERAKGGGKL